MEVIRLNNQDSLDEDQSKTEDTEKEKKVEDKKPENRPDSAVKHTHQHNPPESSPPEEAQVDKDFVSEPPADQPTPIENDDNNANAVGISDETQHLRASDSLKVEEEVILVDLEKNTPEPQATHQLADEEATTVSLETLEDDTGPAEVSAESTVESRLTDLSQPIPENEVGAADSEASDKDDSERVTSYSMKPVPDVEIVHDISRSDEDRSSVVGHAPDPILKDDRVVDSEQTSTKDKTSVDEVDQTAQIEEIEATIKDIAVNEDKAVLPSSSQTPSEADVVTAAAEEEVAVMTASEETPETVIQKVAEKDESTTGSGNSDTSSESVIETLPDEEEPVLTAAEEAQTKVVTTETILETGDASAGEVSSWFDSEVIELDVKKIAVVSDMHSNYKALEAVLEDLKHRDFDALICLGDMVGYYTEPNQVVDAIRDAAQVTVMGNHDFAIIEPEKLLYSTLQEGAQAALDHNKDLLTQDNKKWLEKLPMKVVLKTPYGTATLVHGDPITIFGYIYGVTPELF